MEQLITVSGYEGIAPEWRITPIANLLAYRNFGVPLDMYDRATLLVGVYEPSGTSPYPRELCFYSPCRWSELLVYRVPGVVAIAIGRSSVFALIGHTDCGMVKLMSRRT